MSGAQPKKPEVSPLEVKSSKSKAANEKQRVIELFVIDSFMV